MAGGGDTPDPQQAVVKAELIFPLDNRRRRGAMLRRSSKRGTAGCWRPGSPEPTRATSDVGIWVSRLDKGAVVEAGRGGQRCHVAPEAIPLLEPGAVPAEERAAGAVLQGRAHRPSQWWGEMVTSKDNGRTWQGRRRLTQRSWGRSRTSPSSSRRPDSLPFEQRERGLANPPGNHEGPGELDRHRSPQ